MERIVVVGADGMLGRSLMRRLAREPGEVTGLDRPACDLVAGDPSPRLASLAPTVVINVAAWTDVAGAEDPTNREAVERLNRDAPGELARFCAERGGLFVHVSTDFVFDGCRDTPYPEEAPTGPLQVYGASKLAGELVVRAACPAALVVRTSTLYGPGRRGRPHFVDAILARARSGSFLEVVGPPVSSPTHAPDLADAIVRLVRLGRPGVVHFANAGGCTRHELARAAVEEAGLPVDVRLRREPADSIPRPAYSVLATERFRRWTGIVPRPWREALADYVRAS